MRIAKPSSQHLKTTKSFQVGLFEISIQIEIFFYPQHLHAKWASNEGVRVRETTMMMMNEGSKIIISTSQNDQVIPDRTF
jgi:hypothetical protein